VVEVADSSVFFFRVLPVILVPGSLPDHGQQGLVIDGVGDELVIEGVVPVDVLVGDQLGD
jgi:hypothetical protein